MMPTSIRAIAAICLLGATVACQNLLAIVPSTRESVTFGTLAHELNGLVYVADDQGYLAAQGLTITFRTFDTGVQSTDAVLAGQVDLAGCAEFVLVGRAINHDPLRTIATIAKSEDQYMMARSDRGIRQVTDLRGKRVGVPRQTVSEFYLGRFLDLHGMNIGQVSLVDVKPAETVDQLLTGQVDAVISWEPFAGQIRRQAPEGLVIWPAQSSQVLYWNIVGTDTWLAHHPGTVARLLAALSQAESFVRAHPDQAKESVEKVLAYDRAYMDYIFPKHTYALALDQSLILAMEDETRWMSKNDLALDAGMPDFLRHVYLDGMLSVKPSAVNIIR